MVVAGHVTLQEIAGLSSLSLVGMVISVFLAFFVPLLAFFFFAGDPLGGILDIVMWIWCAMVGNQQETDR